MKRRERRLKPWPGSWSQPRWHYADEATLLNITSRVTRVTPQDTSQWIRGIDHEPTAWLAMRDYVDDNPAFLLC